MVPETTFLEIIAVGDSTEAHAAEGSISLEVLTSKEINNSRHFPVIKMITINPFNAVVVVVTVVAAVASLVEAVAAVSTNLVEVAVASTTPAEGSTIPEGSAIPEVSIILVVNQEVVSINLVASIVNLHLVEEVSAVVVITVAVQLDSARVLETLEIVHRHQTTKDTILISKIFTIM